MKNHLTDDVARQVFDILVEFAGCDEELWTQFACYLTDPSGHPHEFRFSGDLGWGGKLYFSRRTFGPNLTVDCYSEDLTGEREEIIRRTNAALMGIDYLLRVTEERELTDEDEEMIKHLLDEARKDPEGE